MVTSILNLKQAVHKKVSGMTAPPEEQLSTFAAAETGRIPVVNLISSYIHRYMASNRRNQLNYFLGREEGRATFTSMISKFNFFRATLVLSWEMALTPKKLVGYLSSSALDHELDSPALALMTETNPISMSRLRDYFVDAYNFLVRYGSCPSYWKAEPHPRKDALFIITGIRTRLGEDRRRVGKLTNADLRVDMMLETRGEGGRSEVGNLHLSSTLGEFSGGSLPSPGIEVTQIEAMVQSANGEITRKSPTAYRSHVEFTVTGSISTTDAALTQRYLTTKDGQQFKSEIETINRGPIAW